MNLTITNDQSLKSFNTFQVDAIAKHFATINSLAELEVLLHHQNLREQLRFVIGQGSNILFCNDIDGLVIKLNIKGIKVLEENKEFVRLHVGAGVSWHDLVLYCLENNYPGIENLALIPGTVGAAPIQNIGAYGVELKDVLESVEVHRLVDGEKIRLENHHCQFAYRDSIFKHEYKDQVIIAGINIKLSKQPVFHIDYGAIQMTLQDMGVTKLSIQAIAKAVMQIRRSKLPDPVKIANAGSFFKNPVMSEMQFEALYQAHNGLPCYELDDGNRKIPAAWLIEQCGWKGKKIGNAGVHEKQALVLVNHGGATGEEIVNLSKQIQLDVKKQFDIDLIPEVTII